MIGPSESSFGIGNILDSVIRKFLPDQALDSTTVDRVNRVFGGVLVVTLFREVPCGHTSLKSALQDLGSDELAAFGDALARNLGKERGRSAASPALLAVGDKHSHGQKIGNKPQGEPKDAAKGGKEGDDKPKGGPAEAPKETDKPAAVVDPEKLAQAADGNCFKWSSTTPKLVGITNLEVEVDFKIAAGATAGQGELSVKVKLKVTASASVTDPLGGRYVCPSVCDYDYVTGTAFAHVDFSFKGAGAVELATKLGVGSAGAGANFSFTAGYDSAPFDFLHYPGGAVTQPKITD